MLSQWAVDNPSYALAMDALGAQPAAIASAVGDRIRSMIDMLRPSLEEAAQNGQVVTAEMIREIFKRQREE